MMTISRTASAIGPRTAQHSDPTRLAMNICPYSPAPSRRICNAGANTQAARSRMTSKASPAIDKAGGKGVQPTESLSFVYLNNFEHEVGDNGPALRCSGRVAVIIGL